MVRKDRSSSPSLTADSRGGRAQHAQARMACALLCPRLIYSCMIRVMGRRAGRHTRASSSGGERAAASGGGAGSDRPLLDAVHSSIVAFTKFLTGTWHA